MDPRTDCVVAVLMLVAGTGGVVAEVAGCEMKGGLRSVKMLYEKKKEKRYNYMISKVPADLVVS